MEKILTYVLEKTPDISEITGNKNLDRLFRLNFLPNTALTWPQLVNLVKLAKQAQEELFILSKQMEVLKTTDLDLLAEVISDAQELNVKILISNTSSADATLIPLTTHLFWTDSLSDFEFLVIYESCFDLILNENCSNYNSVSDCLENLTSNKMLIYPMVYAAPTIAHQNVQQRMERLMRMSIYLQENKLKLG